MRRWFTDHRPCWSSQLLTTEAHRAAARLGVNPDVIDELLDGISLVLPSASTFDVAGRRAPSTPSTWPPPVSSAPTSRAWSRTISASSREPRPPGFRLSDPELVAE